MPAKAFISYSHVDQELVARLKKHLAQLERDGTLSGWFDGEIHAGANLDAEISRQLTSADVFLACASPDYIASYYCYEKELNLALERERNGKIAVVPVILEHCEWLQTPLKNFKAVPQDGKPVAEFTNPNVAFLNVATEIRRLCEQRDRPSEFKSMAQDRASPSGDAQARYRIKRDFDKLHKRDFIERSFVEIYSFFEASVQELQSVPDVEARLSKTGDSSFSCTVINRGLSRGFETLHVRRGGSWGAIDILYGEKNQSSTSNGGFGVQADDYQLYFTLVLSSYTSRSDKLSARDVAQLLWDELLSKVGIGYA